MSSFRLLLALFCSLFACVNANFEDHVKKPKNKSKACRTKNVDFIYMINLDQRPEKWQKSIDQLRPYGIRPYRFSAVNGWELDLETINDLGVKFQEGMREGMWGTSYKLEEGELVPEHEVMTPSGKTYFVHCMGRGTIGIALSHLSILKDAYDSGYKTIWVMEDDIDVLSDPTVISGLIEKLDKLVGDNNWDILFTDIDFRNSSGEHVRCANYAPRPNFTPKNPEKFAKRVALSPDFSLVGSRYGAHSMIVRRSGMKKILDFTRQYGIFLPFDMDFVLPPGMKLYCLNYDVISQLPKAISDNGTPPPSR